MLERMRTCPEVKVHALLDKLCIYHPFAELFCPAGDSQSRSDSGRYTKEALIDYLAPVEYIERRFAAATKTIRQQVKPNPRARLLMIIPGICYPTALCLPLNEVGNMRRFPSAAKLCACGGIVQTIGRNADLHWQSLSRRRATATPDGR